MNITADTVKQLRERTGAGMMECKKALVETKGDLDAAAELMRKTGLAKADKKAARGGAEGTVAVERSGLSAVLVEVNCETDFVARGDEFQEFAREVSRLALEKAPADVSALLKVSSGSSTLDEKRRSLIVTTNLAFKEWNTVFPNATCIVTMLDRLLHHADVTVIEGDSYRVRESEQETAARRRKK